nr:hypothetical protein [Actinomycetota bacterium]
PVPVFTGAPFMPDPPTSIPKTSIRPPAQRPAIILYDPVSAFAHGKEKTKNMYNFYVMQADQTVAGWEFRPR